MKYVTLGWYFHLFSLVTIESIAFAHVSYSSYKIIGRITHTTMPHASAKQKTFLILPSRQLTIHWQLTMKTPERWRPLPCHALFANVFARWCHAVTSQRHGVMSRLYIKRFSCKSAHTHRRERFHTLDCWRGRLWWNYKGDIHLPQSQNCVLGIHHNISILK